MPGASLDDDLGSIAVLQNLELPVKEANKAAEEIYLKYLRLLEYYLQRQGASAEDAEEWAHDVLIRVIFSKIHQFTPRPDGSFQAWLFTVARNAYSNWQKKQRRMVEFNDRQIDGESNIEEGEALTKAAAKGTALLSEYMRNYQSMSDDIEAAADLEQWLNDAGLSDFEKSVVRLRIYLDLKPRDIAALTPGQSAENVARVFYNAKAKLGKWLDTQST